MSVQVRWGFPEVLEQPCVPAAVVKLCCFFKGPFLLLGMKDTSLELYQTASAEPWKFKTGSISLTGKGFTKWNLWLLCGRCLLKTYPTPAGYSEVVQSLNFNLLWNISSLCAWLESVIWLRFDSVRSDSESKDSEEKASALREQSSSYRTTLNIHTRAENLEFFFSFKYWYFTKICWNCVCGCECVYIYHSQVNVLLPRRWQKEK